MRGSSRWLNVRVSPAPASDHDAADEWTLDRRMRLFIELLHPEANEPILDVGGDPELWREAATRPHRHPQPHGPGRLRRAAARMLLRAGDGRRLPFPSNEFPIVFSNSVLEHVGDLADQRCFASEIRRVGRRFWVQTPNRRFPIEPHLNFPAFQWLPRPLAHEVIAHWPLSYHRRDGLTAKRPRTRSITRGW